MSDNEDNVSVASLDDNDSINEEEEEDSVLESIHIEDDIDENELEYEDVDLEALEEQVQTKKSKTQKVINKPIDEDIDNLSLDSDSSDISDDEDDEEEDDDYVKRFEKLDRQMKEDHVANYHPTSLQENYQEIATLSLVVRNDKGEIIDPLHKTIPIMTKYEKARILGQRAKQINSGANIFVQPKQETFDGYLIALQELEEKKLPFIIRRPLPNGHSEYWKASDLEYLHEIAY
jgi:DNA-directed RNA polymerases I, II, and III subunit RPABC2